MALPPEGLASAERALETWFAAAARLAPDQGRPEIEARVRSPALARLAPGEVVSRLRAAFLAQDGFVEEEQTDVCFADGARLERRAGGEALVQKKKGRPLEARLPSGATARFQMSVERDLAPPARPLVSRCVRRKRRLTLALASGVLVQVTRVRQGYSEGALADASETELELEWDARRPRAEWPGAARLLAEAVCTADAALAE